MSEDILYNPLTPSFRRDPYPALRKLRETDPVHWAAGAYCWVLTRYNDIKSVLSSRQFGIGMDRMMDNPLLLPTLSEPYNVVIRTQILAADPPDHTRIRGLMSRSFAGAAVKELRPLVQRVANELIDDALQTGRIDLIKGFGHALPFHVISEILGVPKEERGPLAHYTHDLMRTTDPSPMSAAENAAANTAALGFQGYFTYLASRRRLQPTDDFFTEMVRAVDQRLITHEEFISNMILTFCAGHDTVVGLFGNGLLALHRNPEQLQLLKDRPKLIRGAVDELLRFDTTLQIARRTAFEDVVIDGRTIVEGCYVLCMLGAANHDPEIYDNPDQLDVTRKNIRPLSFGGGIHHCLGALLARVEGEIGVKTLLHRLPDLQLETLEPTWKQNVFIRSPISLPATFEPSSARPSLSTTP